MQGWAERGDFIHPSGLSHKYPLEGGKLLPYFCIPAHILYQMKYCQARISAARLIFGLRVAGPCLTYCPSTQNEPTGFYHRRTIVLWLCTLK